MTQQGRSWFHSYGVVSSDEWGKSKQKKAPKSPKKSAVSSWTSEFSKCLAEMKNRAKKKFASLFTCSLFVLTQCHEMIAHGDEKFMFTLFILGQLKIWEISGFLSSEMWKCENSLALHRCRGQHRVSCRKLSRTKESHKSSPRRALQVRKESRKKIPRYIKIENIFTLFVSPLTA